MHIADLKDVKLHYRWDGDPSGRVLVFANSLGTDLRLWDQVLPHLAPGFCILRYDMRGHGLSDCPAGPYSMNDLTGDAERLLDHLNITSCAFVGLSIGGMVGQGLVRSSRVEALVLANTAARMGTRQMWQDRMAAIEAGGIGALADAVLERWFTPAFLASNEALAWRNMLLRTPVEGYLGACAAIADADLTATTSHLDLPTLVIAGREDGASPPPIVRAMADLIKDARYCEIAHAGHLPCVEQPAIFARALTAFLKETGYV